MRLMLTPLPRHYFFAVPFFTTVSLMPLRQRHFDYACHFFIRYAVSKREYTYGRYNGMFA